MWAKQGECDRNPRYMKSKCARACGVCSDAMAANKGYYLNFDLNSGIHHEYYNTCTLFFILCVYIQNIFGTPLEFGTFFLLVLVTFRIVHSKPSVCIFASVVGDQCVNAFPDDKCKSWKDLGDCVANKEWMSQNCKKACGVCDNSNDSTGSRPLDIILFLFT